MNRQYTGPAPDHQDTDSPILDDEEELTPAALDAEFPKLFVEDAKEESAVTLTIRYDRGLQNAAQARAVKKEHVANSSAHPGGQEMRHEKNPKGPEWKGKAPAKPNPQKLLAKAMKMDPESKDFIKKLQFGISEAVDAKSDYTLSVRFHKRKGGDANPTYSYRVTTDNGAIIDKLKIRMKHFLYYSVTYSEPAAAKLHGIRLVVHDNTMWYQPDGTLWSHGLSHNEYRQHMYSQGLEPELLVDHGFRPLLTTNPGSKMKTNHKAYELYFEPGLIRTFGYELAEPDETGKPTFFDDSIPIGVSFQTKSGKVLFSRLAPQGGCRWCLHHEVHENLRLKGSACILATG